jgi:hypothetical protein
VARGQPKAEQTKMYQQMRLNHRWMFKQTKLRYRAGLEAAGNAAPNMATFSDWKIHQPKASCGD